MSAYEWDSNSYHFKVIPERFNVPYDDFAEVVDSEHTIKDRNAKVWYEPYEKLIKREDKERTKQLYYYRRKKMAGRHLLEFKRLVKDGIVRQFKKDNRIFNYIDQRQSFDYIRIQPEGGTGSIHEYAIEYLARYFEPIIPESDIKEEEKTETGIVEIKDKHVFNPHILKHLEDKKTVNKETLKNDIIFGKLNEEITFIANALDPEIPFSKRFELVKEAILSRTVSRFKYEGTLKGSTLFSLAEIILVDKPGNDNEMMKAIKSRASLIGYKNNGKVLLNTGKLPWAFKWEPSTIARKKISRSRSVLSQTSGAIRMREARASKKDVNIAIEKIERMKRKKIAELKALERKEKEVHSERLKKIAMNLISETINLGFTDGWSLNELYRGMVLKIMKPKAEVK